MRGPECVAGQDRERHAASASSRVWVIAQMSPDRAERRQAIGRTKVVGAQRPAVAVLELGARDEDVLA
jgi:hypothetical protein